MYSCISKQAAVISMGPSHGKEKQKQDRRAEKVLVVCSEYVVCVLLLDVECDTHVLEREMCSLMYGPIL